MGRSFGFRTAQSLGSRPAPHRDRTRAGRDAEELVPRMRSSAGGGGAVGRGRVCGVSGAFGPGFVGTSLASLSVSTIFPSAEFRA